MALLDGAADDLAVILGEDGGGWLALRGVVSRRAGEPVTGYTLVRIDEGGADGLEPQLEFIGGDRSAAGELALVTIHGDLWVGQPGSLAPVAAEGLFFTQARWDPAGERLAVTAWADGWRPWDQRRVRERDALVEAMDANVYVSLPGLTGWQQLTHARGADYNPVWSPDGTELLFTSVRTGYASFFLATLPAGESRQLTNLGAHRGGAATPVGLSDRCFWDASSGLILYETRTASGAAQLWRMAPDSGPAYHGAYRDLAGVVDGVALARPPGEAGWVTLPVTGGER